MNDIDSDEDTKYINVKRKNMINIRMVIKKNYV